MNKNEVIEIDNDEVNISTDELIHIENPDDREYEIVEIEVEGGR